MTTNVWVVNRDREHWKRVQKTIGVCQSPQRLASSRMQWNKRVLFNISNIKVFTHIQQVGNVQSFSSQKINCSMKIIWVNIHKKLVSPYIKERRKLDIPVVYYISPKSKTKLGQSRMNETHNSGCLLRVLLKSEHLGLFWMNSVRTINSSHSFHKSKNIKLRWDLKAILARLRNCLKQVPDIRANSQNDRKLFNRASSKGVLLNKACKALKRR